MSLTCHEEIEHVGRVGRGCYDDASDLSSTSRACRARGIWRTTPHTDKRVTYTPQQTAGRPIRMSRVSGVSARMSQGCYEETASVEYKLNATNDSVCDVMLQVSTTTDDHRRGSTDVLDSKQMKTMILEYPDAGTLLSHSLLPY